MQPHKLKYGDSKFHRVGCGHMFRNPHPQLGHLKHDWFPGEHFQRSFQNKYYHLKTSDACPLYQFLQVGPAKPVSGRD